ncbi:solute carrier family 22 member 6 [Epinephelus moara]|uniref:solute carrier family 22 member 6 n=1 Tax=Epinephelus moara TaxID=300413 RepID=UPI00214E0DEB|nr:solute carrier family 22 member 6 [Epinephelus moara]
MGVSPSFFTIVYIHPRASISAATQLIAEATNRLDAISPDAPKFILGDFNQCQIHRTLKTSLPMPLFGASYHSSVLLMPIYKPICKKQAHTVKTFVRWYSESARWLVLNGRSEDALKSLQRVARVNGKTETIDKLTVEVLHSHMKKEIESSRSSLTAYDLLRTRGIRRISICLLAVWFSTSFAYYGIAMDLQKFGVSIYLIQIIFGAVDIPAKILAVGMLTYLGRRVTQATCLFMSALVIFANIFVPTDMQNTRTTLACLGKGFTSASFTTVYLFTGELYPTVIRQTGMGFVSTMARVGSMAAPAVLILDEVFPALPSVVYGGAAVLAGCFACFLPETLNVPLPETINDVEEKWSRLRPAPRREEGVSLKEGGDSCVGGMVSAESVALKELKEAEGIGLNAL